MPKELPVIAAIPNYNMGDNLRRLLPQVLAQHYNAVFVLDDASTDHSVDVVSGFGGEVKLVRSPENRGAGANRNQIIDHVGEGAIIHFIDADMDLETPETPAVAREVVGRYADRRVGLIGGLVSRVDGSQEHRNYGPAPVFSALATSGLPLLTIDRLRKKPRLAAAIQRVAAPVMRDWPTYLSLPLRRQLTGCMKEICLFIPAYSGRSAAMTLCYGHTRFRIWQYVWKRSASSGSSIRVSGSCITTLMSGARIVLNGKVRRLFIWYASMDYFIF